MKDGSAAWMDEGHRIFQESIGKLFDDVLTPQIANWREAGVVGRDFWRQVGEAGVMGAAVPEQFGGSGGDLGFEMVTIYEQSKRGDSAWGYGIQSIVIHYLTNFASEEQKARWLPPLIKGEIVASLAMTEPGTGSDLQAIQTRAEKDGNNYRIQGSKIFITNGGSCDLICLVAKTDSSKGAKGTSIIMVETKDLEGFRRGKPLKKLGLKGQDTAELFFDDVKVPQTNLLGPEENQGFVQMMKQLPFERLIIAVAALGAIDGALEQTLAYVKERKAFGQRIMDFQNTRFKLAEAATKIEVTRSFVNDCVVKLNQGTLDPATAAMAKWWATQMQCEVLDECLQLHGGYGYMLDYPIANLYADARVQKIYGGTNEIMKELIARSLDA